jgi:hypothetical protein
MALFGRKNANKNNDSPKGENNRDPAEKEERVAGNEPEPAPVQPAEQPAEEHPEPEKPKEQEQEQTREPTPERPAPEPFIPFDGVTARPSPAPSSASGGTSRFHTPEGFDFNRYFLAERRIALENVSYESQRPLSKQLHLNIRDTIVAQLLPGGVKVTYNRTLSFDPEGPFVLSVSFSVMLVFNPGTRGEIDWKTIDVAEEFKKNCPGLVSAMNAKIGLLVAEITNAGGTPIFPPIVR